MAKIIEIGSNFDVDPRKTIFKALRAGYISVTVAINMLGKYIAEENTAEQPANWDPFSVASAEIGGTQVGGGAPLTEAERKFVFQVTTGNTPSGDPANMVPGKDGSEVRLGAGSGTGSGGQDQKTPQLSELDKLKAAIRGYLDRGDDQGAYNFALDWYKKAGSAETAADEAANAILSVVRAAGNYPAPTAEQLRREQFEGTSAGRGLLFRDVLRGQTPNYDYAPEAVRETYESGLSGLESTFFLDPAFHQGRTETESPSFQDFLRSGRGAYTPGQIQAQLSRLGGLEDKNVPGGSYDETLLEKYRSGPGADVESFQAILKPYLRNTSPAMRAAAERAARRRFERQRLETPGTSFVNQLNQMGGRFFN